jgi:hypothetical protein
MKRSLGSFYLLSIIWLTVILMVGTAHPTLLIVDNYCINSRQVREPTTPSGDKLRWF